MRMLYHCEWRWNASLTRSLHPLASITHREASIVRQALEDYSSIVQQHPGLAVTEYARLSRALMLFQTGRAADAVLQLDDLRVSMLGCACQLHSDIAGRLRESASTSMFTICLTAMIACRCSAFDHDLPASAVFSVYSCR